MGLRFLILAATLMAGAAQADPPPMAAAGVLERDGRTECSAVLIAPDLIATAAHCVAGKKLVSEGGAVRIVFRTGAYPGHPAHEFDLVQVAAHPLYAARAEEKSQGLAADVALARLAAPVPTDVARPLPPGEPIGDEPFVLIGTWPAGAGVRARERRCPVLSGEAAIAVLSCVVVPGESGGAVVRLTGAGPELAAIVAATGRSGHQPFAYAVQARSRILQLKAIHGF